MFSVADAPPFYAVKLGVINTSRIGPSSQYERFWSVPFL